MLDSDTVVNGEYVFLKVLTSGRGSTLLRKSC